jgi:hypothetical protein
MCARGLWYVPFCVLYVLRYVYLWLYYATFEELSARDPAKAREVLVACLGVVPHRHFTFAKVCLCVQSDDDGGA